MFITFTKGSGVRDYRVFVRRRFGSVQFNGYKGPEFFILNRAQFYRTTFVHSQKFTYTEVAGVGGVETMTGLSAFFPTELTLKLKPAGVARIRITTVTEMAYRWGGQ